MLDNYDFLHDQLAATAVATTETAPALVAVQGCMTPKTLGQVIDPHPSRSADCLHLLYLLQMPSIERPTSAGQRSLQEGQLLALLRWTVFTVQQ